MLYILRLKSNLERVDGIRASSLSEAKEFYLARKQMDEKTFDNLYVIMEEIK